MHNPPDKMKNLLQYFFSQVTSWRRVLLAWNIHNKNLLVMPSTKIVKIMYIFIIRMYKNIKKSLCYRQVMLKIFSKNFTVPIQLFIKSWDIEIFRCSCCMRSGWICRLWFWCFLFVFFCLSAVLLRPTSVKVGYGDWIFFLNSQALQNLLHSISFWIIK